MNYHFESTNKHVNLLWIHQRLSEPSKLEDFFRPWTIPRGTRGENHSAILTYHADERGDDIYGILTEFLLIVTVALTI